MLNEKIDSSHKEEFVMEVIDQIKVDLEHGDITAIEELLNNISFEKLIAYLPEEKVDSMAKYMLK